jgi:two-component system, NarL family, sensor kinase
MMAGDLPLGGPDPVRAAVTRFAVVAFISAIVIGAVGVALFQRFGTNEALRDVRELTRVYAEVVEPEITDGLLRRDPRSIAQVDRVVRERVLSESVVRVKIWTGDGRIVYSDEHRLIGRRFIGSDGDRASLETEKVQSHVPDLSDAEHVYERDEGKLLDVFIPISTPNGRRLLFETHYRYSDVAQVARRTWRNFAPGLLAALLLFGLVQFPLALQLARRVREAQRGRVEALQRAVQASDDERRRIAGDLHDGVVHNLAGVSYFLAGVAESAPPELASQLREAAAQTRQGIRELRTLLVEIYPPELQRAGLEVALGDLLAPCAARGLETKLQVDEGTNLPERVEGLFFRVAQEALRNVTRHADAELVKVEVDRLDGHARLAVSDDGRGFDLDGSSGVGHFGLRILRDLAQEAGGELRVDSKPGRGTTVSLEVPVE